MRVLAVDHGERRIGLAISDPTGTLARPLMVFEHTSRAIDAARVNEAAVEQGVGLIVVGQSFDEEGRPNAAGRRADRFADALKSQTSIPIVLWDESMSTQDARAARLASGVARKRRGAPVDAQAAAVILQSYLEARPTSSGEAKASPADARGKE
jgi:putative Holliday junction resolvase